MKTRRHFLKGVASSLALPLLPSFGGSEKARAPIKRLGFIYIPNGVNVDKWYSKDQTNLNDSLKPLARLENHFSLLKNLACQTANANGDGAGDHARANASFLTGRQAKKTAGSDIHVGVSVDQIAAQTIGYKTRIPSLELSTSLPRRSGLCDSGYSCAYVHNLSWINESTPAPAENNPRLAFEKLFGSGDRKEDLKRLKQRKSVLDFVKSEASYLQKRVGRDDSEKLEEYFTSIRELEKRIEVVEALPDIAAPNVLKPEGVPDSYREHIRMQFEVMKLAFQSDATRISTFLLGVEGSSRAFPEIGVNGKHHQLSHHRGDLQSLEDLAKIDLFYASEFARFLQLLKETKDSHDPEKSLLDSSMLLYGGGIKDGNKHNHSDLPLILAGHGATTIPVGRTYKAAEQTPLTNLYVSLLAELGVNKERVGDSTGVLKLKAV